MTVQVGAAAVGRITSRGRRDCLRHLDHNSKATTSEMTYKKQVLLKAFPSSLQSTAFS